MEASQLRGAWRGASGAPAAKRRPLAACFRAASLGRRLLSPPLPQALQDQLQLLTEVSLHAWACWLHSLSSGGLLRAWRSRRRAQAADSGFGLLPAHGGPRCTAISIHPTRLPLCLHLLSCSLKAPVTSRAAWQARAAQLLSPGGPEAAPAAAQAARALRNFNPPNKAPSVFAPPELQLESSCHLTSCLASPRCAAALAGRARGSSRRRPSSASTAQFQSTQQGSLCVCTT